MVNSLLQLLGEQKGTQPNTPSDMYTPQPFNQFNQQQFQQFPQQFNNFGQNQPFPNQFQQQFPLLFNQSSFSQFPFNQQPFNNNQFPQSTSPQANAPLTPFMQPMANNGNVRSDTSLLPLLFSSSTLALNSRFAYRDLAE